jgi:bifunctional non-homologous end joining protein LigD
MAGMPGTGGQRVTVAGRVLSLTNLDKVLYSATGTTKAEVLAYYAAVSEPLLAWVRDRPLTRKRWPDGVGTAEQPGMVFFEKQLPRGAPDWVATRPIEHHERTTDYPLCNDLATLTWLSQLAVLELHVPQWRFDAAGDPLPPDRLVLDLDPGAGVTLDDCAAVALRVRAALLDLGHETLPVTSGSKGIHLYAPLDGSLSSEAASELARTIAQQLQRQTPIEVTSVMRRDDRDGKVFIDWSQNNANKTTIAPFSLRGRLRPTVATPRTWAEIEAGDLRQLEFEQVLERLRAGGFPAAPPTLDDAAAGTEVARPPAPEPTTRRPTTAVRRPTTSHATTADAAWAEPDTPAPTASATTRPTTPTQAEPDTPSPTGSRIIPPTTLATTSVATDPGAAAPPAGPLSPLLATAASRTDLRQPSGWQFEMKWDGIRVLVHIADGVVRLVGRRGRDETARYPDLVPDLAALACRDAVLDGEVVVTDTGGAPRFELLQARINLTRPGEIAQAALAAPAQLMLFDLLSLDGTLLLDQPYLARRAALEELVGHGTGRLHVPAAFEGDLDAALSASLAFGLEGVVAKRPDSRYHPGRRSADWLKVKHRRTQAVVVVGWRHGQGELRGRLGSLLVAVPGPAGLVYAGRVGSGLTDAGIATAEAALADLACLEPPLTGVPAADSKDAHWVEPLLVAEVGYGERTSTDRLRHPVWLGWRPDLEVADVVWE